MKSQAFTQKHPLKRLLSHLKDQERDIKLGFVYSVLNKVFDLAPPILIGASVDVVVKNESSFIAEFFGVTETFNQLIIVAILTIIVWALKVISNTYWVLSGETSLSRSKTGCELRLRSRTEPGARLF